MLVLALQFSRGDEGERGRRSGARLEGSTLTARSLTTEERTKQHPIDPTPEAEPTTTTNPSDGPPVHQLGRCLDPRRPDGRR